MLPRTDIQKMTPLQTPTTRTPITRKATTRKATIGKTTIGTPGPPGPRASSVTRVWW
jgi:hypothetical protein